MYARILICLLLAVFGAKERVISVPAGGGDATPALQAAIEQARRCKGRPVTIELQNADYHLYRSSASAYLYYVSNTTSEAENPDATKHIGLWLKGLKNVTIDGRGARLVMHGEMTGFVIDSCRNIRLEHFTLTSADPTVPEMTVTETGPKHMVVRVHPQSQYTLEDGRLSFRGEGWAWSKGIAQIYDPEKDITWRSWMPLNDTESITEEEPGVLRFEYDHAPDARPGQVFQMRDSFRDEVCGLIQYSRNVRLEDLHIAFTSNFSIVSQMARDITLHHLTFEPEAGGGRTCAGFADFVHCSGCSGRILVEDSRFVGAQDDPINVHGTHLAVQEFISPKQLRLRYMHSQSYGFQSFLKGDRVELVDPHTLLPLGAFRVKDSRMESPRELVVTFTKPVPKEIMETEGLVVENTTWTPEVVIRNNYFARIPTRGILVSTRRKVLIENNTFFRMMYSGVLIADDARSWFESGPVRDVTIRDNHFIECGNPVIKIAPENDRNEGCVHRGIRIENNRFDLSGPLAVYARSVDGLRIFGNTILRNGEKVSGAVETPECIHVETDAGN